MSCGVDVSEMGMWDDDEDVIERDVERVGGARGIGCVCELEGGEV